MIEAGDIVRAHHVCWVDPRRPRQYYGIIIEIRDNALWGVGSARVLCSDDVIRDFGIWEMSPAQEVQ